MKKKRKIKDKQMRDLIKASLCNVINEALEEDQRIIDGHLKVFDKWNKQIQERIKELE